MLRITVLNDAQGAIFKMEGKLAQDWVDEAEQAWTAFVRVAKQQNVVIDLRGVSFVDDPGRELLARMHSSGAKLIGRGPMTSALIEEICGDDRPRGGWLRGVLNLFFLLPFAVLISGGNILANCRQTPAPEHAAFATQGCILTVHQPVRFTSVLGDRRHGINLWKGLSR